MPTPGAVQHRIEGLDLLRGFAILLVLLRHSWPDQFGGAGIVGVVIFFTLSGYLITGLLIADLRRYGRVRYARFYRNRAIRLLPALGFLVLGFVVVEGIFDLMGTRESVLRSVVIAATYTMNVPGFDHGSPSMSHLWTLANEEQFYLVWPLVLAVGIRFRKLRLLVVAAGLTLLVALAGTIVVSQPDLERIYSLPTTWTISMVIGAAAQIGQRLVDRILRGRRLPLAAVIGFFGLVALSFLPEAKTSMLMYVFGGIGIGLLTVCLIWFFRNLKVVPRAGKPLLWLGTVSYAAYLWNYPVMVWTRETSDTFWPWLTVVLTLALAATSWFAVELPFNRLKQRLNHRAKINELDPVFASDARPPTTG